MNNLFTPDIKKQLLKNIQTVLTLAYIFAVAIGMLFNYQKYKLFSINIFDYASLYDFVIAPFADFNIFLFTFTTFIIIYLIYYLDDLWQTKHPLSYAKFMFKMNKEQWYERGKYSMGVMVILFYLYLASGLYAKMTYTIIHKETLTKVVFADDSTEKGLLIGKTSDFVFLKTQDNKVKAIPMNAMIKSIELK